MSSLKSSLRKFIGKNVIIHYVDINDNTLLELNYEIPSTFASWWKKHSWAFVTDSKFVIDPLVHKIFIYEESPSISSTKIKQDFKE